MRPCIEQKVGNPLQKTTQQEQIIETMDGIILNNKLDSFCLSSLDHLNLVKCQNVRGMGKKFGESRGRKVKSDYQNDGFYQIRILKYLSSYREANLTEFRMKGEYGITSNKTRLKRLLEEMIDDGWIKKTIPSHSPNVKIYSLNKKGHQMKDFIRELQQNDPKHPLFDCRSFIGIKSLG